MPARHAVRKPGASAGAVLAIAVGAAGLVACSPPSRPSLVLITLDTTRADRLGCYGHRAATSPHLDRFAASATVYERAYATSSWTLPSHASLLTGLRPMQHGAESVPDGPDRSLGYGVRPLAESFTTVAEHLRAAGYRTGAVVGGPALARELGLAQGFELYRDELDTPARRFVGKRAEEVADQAIELVRRFGREPYLLFVNFFDPHAPYRPPPPHDAGLPEQASPELAKRLLEQLFRAAPPRPVAALEPSERSALDALLAGYDAEIRYMDLHLGRLLQAIADAPGGERSLIAITADHGESFGEHYLVSHGAHLYEDNVWVPLIVRAPLQTRGRRVAEPVQNHRLAATLLGAASLPVPDSIARPLGAPSEVIVTEVTRSDANIRLFGDFFDRDLRAIYAPPLKLIVSSRGTRELFDFAADPGEIHELSASRSERARALAKQLATIAATYPPLFGEVERATLRPETEEALRALGYAD
jgi:arylsulfatase A-like enzyme